MSDCLFCKMIAGEIEPDTVFEDDDVFAFRDINPQAPVHVLVVPKKHIATLNDLSADDAALVGRLQLAATAIAAREGIDADWESIWTSLTGPLRERKIARSLT